MPYFFLSLAFTCNAIANILLKIGAQRAVATGGGMTIATAKDPFVILGVLAFAVNALFYFLALRHIAVSVAYPIMVVMSLLLIDAFAVSALQESLRIGQLVGYAIMLTGIVFVVAFGARAS
ncbi:hypothetical protein HY635_01180 [Candidatus Uhrbacteria bacterium]|nr:hypothetical protein [Candidatus Uhrbacteria bacterium]